MAADSANAALAALALESRLAEDATLVYCKAFEPKPAALLTHGEGRLSTCAGSTRP